MSDNDATPAGQWLSTNEAAARLGITTRTLYRLIDQGELPGYRVGRVIRLRAPEVDAYIEASRIEPGTLQHLYPDSEEQRARRAKKTTKKPKRGT